MKGTTLAQENTDLEIKDQINEMILRDVLIKLQLTSRVQHNEKKRRAVIRLPDSKLNTSYWLIFSLIWRALTVPNFSNRGNGRENTASSGSNRHKLRNVVCQSCCCLREEEWQTWCQREDIWNSTEKNRKTERVSEAGEIFGTWPSDQDAHSDLW